MHQMAKRSGHPPALAFQVAFAPASRADDTRDITRDAGLFGNDDAH
jgi:hypothetical protein